MRNATDRDLVTDAKLSQAVRALDSLNEWLSTYGQLTDWQQHDLEMAFKRIQYKTEKAAWLVERLKQYASDWRARASGNNSA